MVNQTIKYLVLSDIHLGHPQNKTENIANNLRRYFKEHHVLIKQVKVIFLAGDIFDKLLMNGSKELVIATEWMSELVMYCKHNNIKLRILEGTPSHDWEQAKMMTTVIKKLKLNLDYHYINTLDIEIMHDLGLTILYIPDEYKHNAMDTYKDVIKLMKEKNLTKVDIAIMHGQFHYQLPMVELESSHDEELYLNLVEHYISIGHIHSSSVFKRILAQGSFDRLAHNEEEDKGGMLITLSPNGDSFKFLKNKHAKIFHTFDYRGNDYETVITSLELDITKLPLGSHVRLFVDEDTSLVRAVKSFKDKYSEYIFKIETKDKTKANETNIMEKVEHIESFSIDRNNISDLLKTEVRKHGLNDRELNIFDSELAVIVEDI